jgi:UrcA family protein
LEFGGQRRHIGATATAEEFIMLKTLFQAALLAAIVFGPVTAAEHRPDVRVSYADLDLSKTEGIKALDRRLVRAVEAACPSRDGATEMMQLRAIRVCHIAKREEIAPLRAAAIARIADRNAELATAR